MAHNLEARLNSYYPIALTVFRVVIGLLFLCEGLTKLFGWPDAAHKAAVGEWPYYYAGWIELVTSLLIIAGLFTRPAAFIACGEMAFAYFTQHLPHGFFPITNGGELAVMFCFAFLLLVFAGGGPYALDARRAGWRSTGAPRRLSGPWRRTRARRR
jgi:putative oxidoreductase